ncbi:MAG: class IV adenylate cyclase [bacterium]|nr:class IV adenylate cyclase [bacterium]
MEQLETEIKFYLADLSSIRQRIMEMGAHSRGRFFESNIRFEDRHGNLKKQKSLLRLRQDRKVSLTYKSTPPEDNDQFKILKELEVAVSDFDTMHNILDALGFHREQVYEKWRETLVLDRTHFCLDSMPFGNFLEIEGPKQDIQKFTVRLDLAWNKRILLNYLEIFEFLKNKLHLKFSDVTFDNFIRMEVNLADWLDLLVAGN